MASTNYLWNEFVSGINEVDHNTYLDRIQETLTSIQPKNLIEEEKIKQSLKDLEELRFQTQRILSESDYLKQTKRR